MDMLLKMFKNDEMRFSIDTIPQNDLSLGSSIIEQYTIFTTVQIYSYRCSPDQLFKYEKNVRLAELEG